MNARGQYSVQRKNTLDVQYPAVAAGGIPLSEGNNILAMSWSTVEQGGRLLRYSTTKVVPILPHVSLCSRTTQCVWNVAYLSTDFFRIGMNSG